MKTFQQLTFLALLAGIVYSCGEATALDEKKNQLEKYRSELVTIKANIAELEKEIATEDPAFAASTGKILVAGFPVKEQVFEHKIELRGSVASRKNVMLSAETMGRITAIHVVEGQNVTQGQLLVSLDASILRNNLAEVKTQLELAQAVFERQERLWQQQIGTEIQYLQSKNNKESLERRAATLESQLAQASVRAPFAGVVDQIPVKLGEMAQPGLPLVRVMNPNDTYILADVPESYLGQFKKGDEVEVFFPVQNVRFKSSVTNTGNVINAMNRTFEMEVKIPAGVEGEFRPNQVTRLILTDYRAEKALTVPTSILQTDATGYYVYAIEQVDGTSVARKKSVTTGQTYQGMTEILSGLEPGVQVIEKGFLEASDGAEVTLGAASK